MKKNRILLFAPNMIGVKGGVHRVQPGHGIGSIAGNLRDLGHEVIIRDTALEGYNNIEDTEFKDLVMIGESYASIKNFIDDVKPDWILVSILFSNLVVHGKKIAEIAKSIDPKIKTILGGNHVNNTYTEVLNDRFVDYVVLGECDFSVGELISSVLEGKDIGNIQGVAFKYDNKIISNGLSARINDLNTLPREARDLMNMEGYFDVGLFHSAKSRSKRVGNIMATRGCPEKCSFCTTPQMWGNIVRWRDPENIFAEIRDIVIDYGIEEIQFDDDTLTANIKKLLMLCDLIEPLNIKWCTPNGVKINYHSKNPTKQDNLYKRMFESGCYQITFGVETGNQDILDNTINKRLPLDTVKPAIESAKKAGMLVHSFWMVGFPGETYEQMEQTIKFAESIGSDSYSVAITTPLPGTKLFNEVAEKNLFIDGLSKEEITERIHFSKGIIKVEGFDSNEEFEKWVNQSNIYLNSLLRKKDPERYKFKYGTLDTDERVLMRQS